MEVKSILNALALGLVWLLLCLPGLRRAHGRRYVLWGALVVAALQLAVFSWLERVFSWLPTFSGNGLWQRYWLNELLVILVGTGAIALLTGLGGWRREEFGLRLRFDPGTGRAVRRLLLPLLAAEAVILWLLTPAELTPWGNHLFQLPVGLAEELVFRGALLALLDRAFRGRVRVLGAELGYGAVASSLVFGLWHGLRVDNDWHVALNFMPMAIPTVGGFALAWCRARSGSLLLPIFVHSGMNEIQQLIALAKALI